MSTIEQKRLIFERLNYTPSIAQDAFHVDESRIRLVAGGERGGKSLSSAMEYLGQFWETPLCWLVAADYERTGAEFGYICDSFTKLGIQYTATKRLDPGEILAEGGLKVVTKSAKDPRKLAVDAPNLIIGCEASQLDYETFLRMRGRIAETRGKLVLSGTFESSLGWYPELFTRWQIANNEDARSFSIPTWSNLAIYPGGRNDPEIQAMEATMPPEWFAERCAGVPMPPHGLVFNEFRVNIHTGIGEAFEFNPNLPVVIWVDPGYAGAHALLAVQKKDDIVYIFDEIYERGLVTSEMVNAAEQKPWWNAATHGVIDIAGTQHQAMPAPVEIWLKEGKIRMVSQPVKINQGIERFKTSLKVNPITNRPGIRINSRCRGLISELGGCPNPFDGQTRVYRWKQDKDGNTLGTIPRDENNHACKAVCYGLVDMLGFSQQKMRRAPIQYF